MSSARRLVARVDLLHPATLSDGANGAVDLRHDDASAGRQRAVGVEGAYREHGGVQARAPRMNLALIVVVQRIGKM